MLELNNLYCMDCMEGMKDFPDDYFDLAIVDPPYGINYTKRGDGSGSKDKSNWINHKQKLWDANKPSHNFFVELFRISQNQIIWGGNYFADKLSVTKSWIIWDKGTGENSYGDGEMAWSSFSKPLKIYKYYWSGGNAKEKSEPDRIHPTQKPIALYKWLLKNYAKPNMKIIDTHVGSGSSIIAFIDFGCDWIGFEIDEDYHKAATERIERHKQQLKLF